MTIYTPIRLFAIAGMVAFASTCAPARTSSAPHEPYSAATCATRPASRVLAESAGERRTRRPPPNATRRGLAYTVKVDCETVGARDLFLSYEDLPPGGGIAPHRHPNMDEIIIVRRGTGVASLDHVDTAISAGSSIYIARHTLVSMRNTGSEPLSIAFIFPHSGYGTYLRDWSVPEGQPVTPLTAEENARRLKSAHWLQVLEP